MPHMTESYFPSANGSSKLYTREYFPDSEAKGIVQLVHGIVEHIVRYDEFAHYLASKGFIVVAHDQLGHGKSIGKQDTSGFFGYDNGWNIAVADIHTLHDLTKAKFPGKPYFLFGHSMGSFLARTYIIRYHTGLDGAIISGTGQQNPLLVGGGRFLSKREIQRHGATFKSNFLNHLAFGSYHKGFKNPRTKLDWLSCDEKTVDQYIADPLCGFVPTAGLIYDMMCGIEFISKKKNMERMNKDLPVLFFSGDCDPVGEQGKGVLRAYNRFLSVGMKDVTMKLYHGGRHEMLNEINKSEVYSDLCCWLNTKCGTCNSAKDFFHNENI